MLYCSPDDEACRWSAARTTIFGTWLCLQGTLLPAAQRLAKRNPDSVLPSVAALLAAAKMDLSAIVPDLLPLLLQMSRHARDTVR